MEVSLVNSEARLGWNCVPKGASRTHWVLPAPGQENVEVPPPSRAFGDQPQLLRRLSGTGLSST
jgi:hypothetical protein